MSVLDFKSLPKILLHDHLDGGLRPQTILDLAEENGHSGLPSDNAEGLTEWIATNARRGNLNLYLETFVHTIGVMQTQSSLVRVAKECAQDMVEDGVVYLESRFAPELFQERGLSFEDILDSVMEGFEAGSSGQNLDIKILCTAIKSGNRSSEIAELAAGYKDKGVVGFDLAGPEDGYFNSSHLEAIETARNAGLRITLHAGEGAGLDSIADALEPCGAERLGHGVRIADDINPLVGGLKLGKLAQTIRDRQIPMEVCPTSNLHTAIAETFEQHPLKMLYDTGFKVTLNTDNRLMSQISMTQEFANCAEAYGWGMEEFRQITINAAESAFISESERQKLLSEKILPAYS